VLKSHSSSRHQQPHWHAPGEGPGEGASDIFILAPHFSLSYTAPTQAEFWHDDSCDDPYCADVSLCAGARGGKSCVFTKCWKYSVHQKSHLPKRVVS
jgi:hypothetical protein